LRVVTVPTRGADKLDAMRSQTLALILALLLAGCVAAQSPAAAQPPKLVLAIVIDQFRYDYLTRFRSEYTGGLKRLLEQGAVFTNANYEHVPTVTAVGHSTFLSGATPALSGIVGNEWWDREQKKHVTSVTPLDDSDKGIRLAGASGRGSSPERLLQSTVADELKMSGKGGKVIGVSIKDRSAILPAGRSADGAYWMDNASGNFVSSTYYLATGELPAWLSEWNRSRPADAFRGRDWMGHKTPDQIGPAYYNQLESTPWGNELIQGVALHALSGEKLGAGAKIDLLSVSYSSNDYVGHRDGPDSAEVRDMAIRVDKLIGALLTAAEAQAGPGRVLVVLTADHGVSPLPEENAKRRMPGGRLNWTQMRAAAVDALNKKFGAGNWLDDPTYASSPVLYFRPNPVPGKTIDRAEVELVAAEVLRAQPHVFRVYTRSQLLNGSLGGDRVDTRVRNGFNMARSPDVLVIPDPYWGVGATGAMHSSPFDYDAHVPLIFMGPQVRGGRYYRNVAINDVAPTLATMLDVETPSGSVGRVLDEMLR
jgi:hypothetical protein